MAQLEIRKPTRDDIPELLELARVTFIQSHGHSASELDITNYINQTYSEEKLTEELNNPQNIYYLLYHNQDLVAYSKIVLNREVDNSDLPKNLTKLERIYLLESHQGLGLAQKLFHFNIDVAKENKQAGIWLYTWKENKRAIRFYEKLGFKIVGEHDFRISDTHSNPNWQYYLEID